MSSIGRPKGINYNYTKSIKLNEDQVNNWDSKEIKGFLDGSHQSIKLLDFLYDLMVSNYELIIDYTPGELEKILEIEEMLGK